MLYSDFYHMQAEAFGSLPVLNLFYGARTHQDGWRYLLRGIAAREPFLLVTGDYGMGKTMLSMMLVRLLKKKDIALVQITDPHCGFSGILRQTAALLGIDAHPAVEESLLTEIYTRLSARNVRTAIPVIIDDAQELGTAALVRLRAFANFNRDGFFPVQLIFFAHPSFTALLQDPGLAAMGQRIKRRHRLTPLTFQETREYIYFRLVKSGAPGAPFFDDDALREIHGATGGVPRLINNICDASLTRAASKLETCIALATVREARTDQAESFIPRVVAPGRAVAAESPERFSAPPVHIDQPHQAETGPKRAAAPVPVATGARIPWMPVAACAAAAAVAACLTVFSLVKFYAPAPPAASMAHRDIPVQRAELAGSEGVDTSVLPAGQAGPEAVEAVLPEAPEAEVVAEAVEQVAHPEAPEAGGVAVVEQAALPDAPEAEIVAGAVASAPPEEPETAVAAEAVEAAPPEQPVLADLLGGITGTSDEGRPFTLRLGCFKSRESARAAAAIYARHRLVPFIAHVNLPQQGRWWIFYTGSFASYGEARHARAGMDLPEADIIPMPYACRIGVFDPAGIEAGILAGIEKIGCVPYMLDNMDGTVSLFAGLYRHRDNAEGLRIVLAGRDISSTVVLLHPVSSSYLETSPDGSIQDSAS